MVQPYRLIHAMKEIANFILHLSPPNGNDVIKTGIDVKHLPPVDSESSQLNPILARRNRNFASEVLIRILA